jgi:ApaG protein
MKEQAVKEKKVAKKKIIAKEIALKKIEVKITCTSRYLVDESSPENHRFLWAYDITITNLSDEIIQLLNRHWRITDMRGKVEEVRGPGVVGLQPLIKAGKEFAYSSFCQLAMPQGTMEGSYEIQTLDEKHFLVDIPKFVLTCPTSTETAFRAHLH